MNEGASSGQISVALCSYNGERFLAEQLRSIESQSRPPDEIVISDDASTDATVSIANDFARAAPVEVRVLEGRERLGTTETLTRAVAACSGDIIVLADQDDVWRSEKLEALQKEFTDPRHPGLVFSDADVTDVNLRPLGTSCWEAVRLSARDRDGLSTDSAFATLLRRQILRRGTVTGATLAFRADLKPLVLPVPADLSESRWRMLHDAWISLLAAAVAPVSAVPQRLVLYRQHSGQQLGLPARRSVPFRHAARRVVRRQPVGSGTEAALAGNLRWMTALSARLEAQSAEFACERALEELSDGLSHVANRIALPPRGGRRWRAVRSDLRLGRYGRYSDGLRSAAWDLVRP